MSTNDFNFDALIPADMAAKAEQLGVKKAHLNSVSMFVLAILAGAFIAMGAIFATTVAAGSVSITAAADGVVAFKSALPYGVTRLLAGLVFCLGLILVVVGGAELFTGNNLIVMAWASGKVSTQLLLKNWLIVYAGNFVGAVGTAGLMFLSKQYTFGSNAVGLTALSTGNSKSALDFVQAIVLGILCNALVCLAVWMTYSARSTTDRILTILPPITAFVAAGFEHSIANMYFIPFALFVKYGDPAFYETAVKAFGKDFDKLTWPNFFINNLIPVTIGNILGGAVFVGAVYWFVYLRHTHKMFAPPAPKP